MLEAYDGEEAVARLVRTIKGKRYRCIIAIVFIIVASCIYRAYVLSISEQMGLDIINLLNESKDAIGEQNLATLVKLFGAPAFVCILTLSVADSFGKLVGAIDRNDRHEKRRWMDLFRLLGAALKFLCALVLILCVALVAYLGQLDSVSAVIALIAMLS